MHDTSANDYYKGYLHYILYSKNEVINNMYY